MIFIKVKDEMMLSSPCIDVDDCFVINDCEKCLIRKYFGIIDFGEVLWGELPTVEVKKTIILMDEKNEICK